jgi:hypothetical protein
LRVPADGAKLVVRCLQAPPRGGIETPQEASQGVSVGKSVQAQQRGNQPVVGQGLRALGPAQTGHDGKGVSQKQIGRMIAPVVVIGPANEDLQEASDLQTPAKTPNQAEAPKASEAASFEGEIEFSRSLEHTSQTHLKGTSVKSAKSID